MGPREMMESARRRPVANTWHRYLIHRLWMRGLIQDKPEEILGQRSVVVTSTRTGREIVILFSEKGIHVDGWFGKVYSADVEMPSR